MLYIAGVPATRQASDAVSQLEALFKELALSYYSPRENINLIKGLPPETESERRKEYLKGFTSTLKSVYCVVVPLDGLDATGIHAWGYCYNSYCRDKSIAIIMYSSSGQELPPAVAAVCDSDLLLLKSLDEARDFFKLAVSDPQYNLTITLPEGSDAAVTHSYEPAIWLIFARKFRHA